MNTPTNSEALSPTTGSRSSDTPETDAAKFYVGTSRNQYTDAGFSEALERERNRAERQRDKLAAILLRDAEEWDQAGDEIGAKQTRKAVSDILSENASVMARPGGGPNT